jgi:hypothetical protein
VRHRYSALIDSGVHGGVGSAAYAVAAGRDPRRDEGWARSRRRWRICGLDVDEAYQLWNEWAVVQRDYIMVVGRGSRRMDTRQSGVRFSG